MAIRRRDAAAAGGMPDGGEWADPAFAGMYPNLHQFLTMRRWADGAPRTPGTCLAFSEGRAVKACLSDKDASLVAFVTAATWADLWLTVELALEDEATDWRPTKRSTQRPGGPRTP